MAVNVNPSRGAAGSATPMTTAMRASAQKKTIKKTPGAKKIRLKELPTFTRQLAALLVSGMPVVFSLTTLEEQTINRSFKSVIAGIRQQIEGGAMLSEAMRLYTDVFDELYVSMFRAGEQGGMLAETAARIASYLEASARLRRKVKSAMMYPAIVLCLALVIVTCMIIWIVPVFANIFKEFGATLPMPTQMLVDTSDVIRAHAIPVVLGVVGLVVLFSKWIKTASGAFAFDKFKINFPVIGELNRKVALARFSQTFAQLTRSGVPILQAMEITAFATGNKVMGKVVLDSMPSVERGEPLSVALEKTKGFPRNARQHALRRRKNRKGR